MIALRRPPIPAELRVTSNFEVIPLFFLAFMLWLLGGLLSYSIWMTAFHSNNWLIMFLCLPLCLLFSFFASFGYFQFSLLGHDGGHGNLNKNAYFSLLLGIVGSSMTPGFMGVSYMTAHWSHHQFTNTDKDPQAPYLATFKIKSCPYLLEGFILGNLIAYGILKDSWTLLIHGHKNYRQYSRTQIIFAVLLNYFLNGIIIVLSLSLLFFDPALFVLAILIPLFFYNVIAGWVSYFEHGDTAYAYQMARSYIHPIVSFLFGFENYHLEHHLFPGVQRLKLRQLHDYLQRQGFYQQHNCIVEMRLSRIFRLIKPNKYPCYSTEEVLTHIRRANS